MSDLTSLFDVIVAGLVAFISKIGYLGIFLGMFLESTPFPLPSEVIMIPAGIAAAHGTMNIFLVTIFGILGNVCGAIFSYFIAESVGRPLLMRFGKYFFFPQERVLKMESFFRKHGNISVFIGRLIPGFRHFISITAGAVKMDLKLFCIYTFLGSTIWTSTLAFLGHVIGDNQGLIKEYLHLAIICCIVFCITIVAIYSYLKKRENF